MKVRSAQAEWKGDLKNGSGTLKTQSGAVDTKYTFAARFEEGPETNPEELIGAAHAGCFSMAFSKQLAERGIDPQRIETTATVNLEKTDAGMTVTGIHLTTKVTSPGADEPAFQEAATAAKAGCPISRLLAPGTQITLDAQLA